MLAATLFAAVAATPAVGSATELAPAKSTRTLRLTPAEMFGLADVAAARGDLSTVHAIYAALERNPDPEVRAEARFRQARQLKLQNRNRDAAVLLRRILDEKPEAAGVRLELAQLLQLLGDSDSALRELRAAQSAGLPPAVARMVDRYSEALRASRPLGASFEIALAPDSNINHATRSDTLGTIFGDFDIDQDSKAKSGLGLSLRGQAYRRFALGSSDHNLLVRVGGFADLYGRTSFNDIAADLAAGPELRLGRNRINVEIGATQRWFGQKPFLRSARIRATWARPLGSRMQARLSGTAALVDNAINDLQDGRAYSAQLSVESALTPTMGLALNVGFDRQSLKDPGYSTTGWRTGIIGWKDIGRSTLTFGAEIGRLRADEQLLLFPEKRSEQYSRLTFGVTMRQLTFGGFAPVARFTIERNKSTIEFYDFSRTRSEIGLVRPF